MKQIDHHTYLTEQEAAGRLGLSTNELLTLVLEGGQPSHLFDDGEHLYLETDVERMAAEARV